MPELIRIDKSKSFEENLRMNGVPNEQFIIGELQQMTLRCGKTYLTKRSQQGGALSPMAKAILVAACGSLAVGTLFGGTYVTFAAQLCVPGSWQHVLSILPFVGAKQAAICAAAQAEFQSAMLMVTPYALKIVWETKKKVSEYLLSQEEEDALNQIAADMTDCSGAVGAALSEQDAGSAGRRSSRKQRISRQKKSMRSQQRRSRQKKYNKY
jgi:hypothetical protein